MYRGGNELAYVLYVGLDHWQSVSWLCTLIYIDHSKKSPVDYGIEPKTSYYRLHRSDKFFECFAYNRGSALNELTKGSGASSQVFILAVHSLSIAIMDGKPMLRTSGAKSPRSGRSGHFSA
jgi:hypothetical protein